MFATPCPMSSTLGLCLSPLMRSETTADISDSIAPSMATVIAGEIEGPKQIQAKVRNLKCRQPGGDASKASADRLDREFEQHNRRGAKKEGNDVTGNPLYVTHENDDHSEGCNGRAVSKGENEEKLWAMV